MWTTPRWSKLQAAMDATPNKRSYIRLAAMHCLLRGMDREDVSETFCRSERMVRLWIIKYSHGGTDALISKPAGGRRLKIALQRLEEVLVPVL